MRVAHTYGGGAVENSHPISVEEGLPAQLDVGDIPDASQDALADVGMPVPCVITVPVLVDGQQGRNIGPVHSAAGVGFWGWRGGGGGQTSRDLTESTA